jgi:LacI family transcriptional regulator
MTTETIQPATTAACEASPRPQHLAVEMRRMIRQGEWSSGSRLPTTRDLAGRFGVSLSTVQGAMRELEIQGLIQRRARVGTFVTAQSGSGRQNRQIAMLWVRTDGLESSIQEGTWTQRIQHSAQETLAEAGRQLVMVTGDMARLEQWEARLEASGDLPAGVISFVNPPIVGLLERLGRRRVPWVTITPLREGMVQNFVSADNFGGGRLVGRCFGRMGLHRCLILSDSIAHPPGAQAIKVSTQDKIHGFIQGCLDEDMPLRGIEYGWNGELIGEEAAYRHTLNYIDRFGPPQGVFAAGGDFHALGAIRALRERGVDVPDQCGVVGGTGLLLGKYAHPALTALGQPMEEMGEAAARMLLKMIEDGVDRTVGQYIPCRMLLRQSLRLNDDVRRMIEQGNP